MADTTAAPISVRRLGHIDYRWVALGVVLLGTIMTILDATIVNIAIKALQVDLHVASYSGVTWVVTGYLLAQGAVIPMSGWASDRFGTKRLYLATILLFTVASAACGLAGNIGQLIFFRVLQGLGGGMLMPIGMTIIMRAVGPQQMGKVMGVFGIPMLLAPAAGPILGGWFVQDFSWRLIFYVNVPIGIAAFVAAYMLLDETPRRRALRLDVAGLLTATPAVLAVMYAVDRTNELGWTSPLVVSLLAVAATLFVAFVATQLRRRELGGTIALVTGIVAGAFGVFQGEHVGWMTVDALSMLGVAGVGVAAFVLTRRQDVEPLLHLELFRDRTFSAAMVLSFLIVTSLFGGMLLLPLFLQQVHGYDAIQTALLLLPQAATAAIAMPLGGLLTDRIGPKPVVTFGLVLLGIGTVVLVGLQPDTSLWVIVVAMALRGFAMGFAMMPSQAAALARVPRESTSRASSITNTVQRVGSSIGIAILVTFLGAQFTVAAGQAKCDPSPQAMAAAQRVMHVESPTQLCDAVAAQLAATAQNNRSSSTAPPPGPLGDFAQSYGKQTLSIAFDRTFALIAVLCFVGLIPAYFLRKPEKPKEMGELAVA